MLPMLIACEEDEDERMRRLAAELVQKTKPPPPHPSKIVKQLESAWLVNALRGPGVLHSMRGMTLALIPRG